MSRPTKVLFFATNVRQYNGYSYAIYELACEIAKKNDIELTLYGFQNFYNNPTHTRNLPTNVYEYDAFANENPKQQGFGFEQITSFVEMNQPDVCIVYNDMVVVTNVINQLYKVANKTFKIIVYIDQVYLHQKKDYIAYLNSKVDFVLAFTPYWEQCVKEQGITLPTDFLQHGFNPMIHYPFPKELARRYYNVKNDDIIILNLNRNQPRKRWDVCLQAFAEVVSRHNDKPVKLLIATSIEGAWNLFEVFERELKKRSLTLEDGMKHLIVIDNPQQLTDEDINILYNLADIGINTCDGEGFGLCNFQQAGIGTPQIVPFIGGFRDFFNDDNAITIKPVVNLYIDNARDGVGGESEVCCFKDFVDAIDKYLSNPDILKEHGHNARKHILTHYKWSDLGERLYHVIKRVVDTPSTLNNVLSVPEEKNDDKGKENTHEVFNLNDIEQALNDVGHDDKQNETAIMAKKKLKSEDNNIQLSKVSPPKVSSPKVSKLLKAKQKSKNLHKQRHKR